MQVNVDLRLYWLYGSVLSSECLQMRLCPINITVQQWLCCMCIGRIALELAILVQLQVLDKMYNNESAVHVHKCTYCVRVTCSG